MYCGQPVCLWELWVFPTCLFSYPLAIGAPGNWNKEFSPQDETRVSSNLMWYLGHTLLPPFLPQLNPCPLHLPPAYGGLLVLLGLWQGPSCPNICELWATRVPTLQPHIHSPGSREPRGLAFLCHVRVCLFHERVQRGWREKTEATPRPPLLTFASSECHV